MSLRVAQGAWIDPRAELADDVEIGPFCAIGPDVRIGPGTRLESHVSLSGRVTLGADNHLFPNVVIGAAPQDTSYGGGDTRVTIGDGNIFREGVTVNRASEKDDGVTRVGNRCFLMANSHVAHDCQLGDGVILANGVLLGGHVRVQDGAVFSGVAAVHHFATVGRLSFVGGLSRVRRDVPPFMLVEGSPCRVRCVNVVALKRNEFGAETIHALHEACRLLFRKNLPLDQARDQLTERGLACPHVVELLDFLQTQQQGRQGRARETRKAA